MDEIRKEGMKDQLAGKAKQVEGRVRDAAGDLTDDVSDDIRGKTRRAEGEAQEQVGKSKQAASDAARQRDGDDDLG
jgi:uncharacterized protein YjbJ (UPF0337 family)